MTRRSIVTGITATLVLSVAIPAIAIFASEITTVGNNDFTTGSVNPPGLSLAVPDAVNCSITLTWTAPTSGLAPDGYDVFRSTTPGGPYTFVKHVGAVTATTDSGLGQGVTYNYVLQSTRSGWHSSNSNELTATTAALCLN